jgi:predicted nuclease with TOPRIM domain
MTLDEALTIANRAYHERRLTHIEPKYISDLRDVAEYIWTNADQLRRAHKLKEVEASAADLDKHNDLLEAENTKLEERCTALEVENTKLDEQLDDKRQAIADLMEELHKLKKGKTP